MKDADEVRNGASILADGDFIPANTRLPYEEVMGSGNPRTLFMEGIGTSSTWGESKVEVRIYPTADNPDFYCQDRVSFTVVRCVYKVCVWRPYVCIRDEQDNIIERRVFRTDYSSPRTMFSDYAYGQQHPDDNHHEKAAYMGHAFARLELRTPAVTKQYWTGQTGMNSAKDWILIDVYDHFKDGDVYWVSFSGSEDGQDKLQAHWEDYYVEPIAGSMLTDGTEQRKMLAVVEHRVRPETGALLDDYHATHDFDHYGLDTTINSPSRCGCASYVGLLTQRAGLDTGGWKTDVMMPIVELDTIPSTWVGVLLHGVDATLEDALTEFCDNDLHPESASWGSPGAQSLKFIDPGPVMDWCDTQTSTTVVNKDRCVIIRYDVPDGDNLDEWRR